MVYDAARSRRDEEVRQWHDQALAAGQQRVLVRTTSGELHSYAKDELGVVTASSHPTVRSAAGFVVMALFFAAVAVFSILLVAGPTSQGQDPLWSALILTAAGVGGAVYSARLAGIAAKARRLRAQRGIPEPTARQFD
jgi:multisubunit Na+/H+ antiporter MnhC subunit